MEDKDAQALYDLVEDVTGISRRQFEKIYDFVDASLNPALNQLSTGLGKLLGWD